ncbi:MAG: DUF3592 domain-containing protein [Prevotellaceae bacterium]|jgi:aminopeptidase C|nr:DUF3592 domain-containing protein [Prevotellaceae bacterium]
MNEFKVALIILMFVEILCIYLCIYLIIKIQQAKQWIRHEAIITHSTVESVINWSTDNTATTHYRYKVTYKYNINSVEYMSNRTFFGDFLWQSFPFISCIIKRKYKVNDRILIYYNLKNPQQSVIKRGFHVIFFLIFATTILVFGVIIWLYKFYI